jgi:hypothetical protein
MIVQGGEVVDQWRDKQSTDTGLCRAPNEAGQKEKVKAKCLIYYVQLTGFLGKDPEKRQARGSGTNFTVLSVAPQQSWPSTASATPSMHRSTRATMSPWTDNSSVRNRTRERQIQEGQRRESHRLLERPRELGPQAQPRRSGSVNAADRL